MGCTLAINLIAIFFVNSLQFKSFFSRLVISASLLCATSVMAKEIHIAVASNFSGVMKVLVKEYEEDTRHRVVLIPGSSGKHYAQIVNGAPFDLFFSADAIRPKLLDEQGLSEPNSRFTYAIGKLVLWSPNNNLVDSFGDVVGEGDFQYLAIANPKLAPYGKAAEEVIRSKDVWKKTQSKLVRGENVAQAYQFVASGNAGLGFVAYSQILKPNKTIQGSYWLVPEYLYSPIEQQAVLLKNNDLARHFLTAFITKMNHEH